MQLYLNSSLLTSREKKLDKTSQISATGRHVRVSKHATVRLKLYCFLLKDTKHVIFVVLSIGCNIIAKQQIAKVFAVQLCRKYLI